MLHKLFTKFKCEYNKDCTLYYGAFRNEKFEWYLQKKESPEVVEQLYIANPKASETSRIYRVSGVPGQRIRFTANKIRRKAVEFTEPIDVFCSKFIPV